VLFSTDDRDQRFIPVPRRSGVRRTLLPPPDLAHLHLHPIVQMQLRQKVTIRASVKRWASKFVLTQVVISENIIAAYSRRGERVAAEAELGS
jgi:hypothetical protein